VKKEIKHVICIPFPFSETTYIGFWKGGRDKHSKRRKNTKIPKNEDSEQSSG
jgi:hypothetical protein